jgi:GNAT superfamily N-acetyltransferase
MQYRIAAEADLSQLSQLRWDFRHEDGFEQPVVSYDEFFEECLEFLKHGLESGFQTYWVAEREGEIIAQIFVHKIELVPRPCKLQDQFGYITNNYTKPAYRGQGIGSKLMEHVIEWAKKEDFELLIVYPSEEAVTYYERSGFISDNEVMERQLRAYYSPNWSEVDQP